MNVAEVCPLFLPYIGGVETHVYEISRRLSKLGVGIKVYTTDPTGTLPKKDTIDGIEVLRFRSFDPWRLYYYSLDLYHELEKLRDVDVVHVHGFPEFPSLAAVLAKDENRKPLILTPHYGGAVNMLGTSVWRTLVKRSYNLLLSKLIFGKSDIIVAVSIYEKEMLKQNFEADERKIRHIPNGVDVKELEGKVKKKSNDTKTILYVGRLEKYKGVSFLIKAFQRLKANLTNSQLVIVGRGPCKEELVSLSRKLEVQDSVTFLENLPKEELTNLYLTSDVFILVSQYESLPIAVLDALAYGLPIIATNVGGLPEIIQTGKTGFLLDFPPDEDELIRITTSLLQDEEYAKEIGARAREEILSKFSWDSVVRNLLDLYEEISVSAKD